MLLPCPESSCSTRARSSARRLRAYSGSMEVILWPRVRRSRRTARAPRGRRVSCRQVKRRTSISERFQLDVAGSVGFEGGTAGVGAVAVELDDEALLRPEKIATKRPTRTFTSAGEGGGGGRERGSALRARCGCGRESGDRWQAQVFRLPSAAANCGWGRRRRRSMSVREGVVTGMPALRVTPLGKRVRDRCTRIPGRPFRRPDGDVMTCTELRGGRISQSPAALVWLRPPRGRRRARRHPPALLAESPDARRRTTPR